MVSQSLYSYALLIKKKENILNRVVHHFLHLADPELQVFFQLIVGVHYPAFHYPGRFQEAFQERRVPQLRHFPAIGKNLFRIDQMDGDWQSWFQN